MTIFVCLALFWQNGICLCAAVSLNLRLQTGHWTKLSFYLGGILIKVLHSSKRLFLPLRFLSEQKFSSLSLIETLSVCVMLLVIFSANTCFGWQRLFAFFQHLKKVKFRLKSGEKLIFQWNAFLSQRILEAKRKEKITFSKNPHYPEKHTSPLKYFS